MIFKLLKRIYENEKLILFIPLSLYLILELINIKLPGLYADEALPALGSLQIIKNVGPFLPSLRIFKIKFPFMLGVPYQAALESYILLPFLWLFGINVVTLRLVPIVVTAFMLIFLYLFLKEFFDKKVALLTLFLLVINSVFLLETKLGLNSASMLHFSGVAALWSLFRWYKRRSDFYLYIGIFVLSLGVSVRVWFLWFVIGMILLALIFNKELQKITKSGILKYIFISFAIFLLGNILFVYYNLSTKFNTFQYIIQHFALTKNLANNLNYFKNLNTRLDVLINYLRGTWPLLMQGNWGNRTPLKEISANHLYPYLFLLAFIWLIISIMFNKISFSKKRIFFILILFSAILLQSPFTLSTLGGPHLFILYPFIQIILGIAWVDIIRNFKKNKIIPTIISCIFSIFIFLECNNILKNNYLYFKNTGGTGNNSDTIYALSKYLEDRKIYKPILMDWGIYHNLIFLSQGKIIPQAFNYIEGGHGKAEFIKTCKANLKETNIYVFHSPEFSNRSEVYPIFREIAEDFGKKINVEKIFYQRDDIPVYVIYSVR